MNDPREYIQRHEKIFWNMLRAEEWMQQRKHWERKLESLDRKAGGSFILKKSNGV